MISRHLQLCALRMYTFLVTYGLNPLTGLKVMVNSPQVAALGSGPLWQRLQHTLAATHVAVGALVPEQAQTLTPWQYMSRLKFFVALEGAADELKTPALGAPTTTQKALPGTATGIQVYHHQEGDTCYKAEVVRLPLLGRSPQRRLRR